MKKMFLALDTSQDGFLTLDEIKLGLTRVLGDFKSQSNDWQVLIEQLDTNNDGKIDYGEFINAAINKCRLLSHQNLEIAFKMFDLDGNGFISREELKDVFQGVEALTSSTLELEDGLWTRIIQEVDTNRDNLISAEEFLNSMQAVFGHHSSVL